MTYFKTKMKYIKLKQTVSAACRMRFHLRLDLTEVKHLSLLTEVIGIPELPYWKYLKHGSMPMKSSLHYSFIAMGQKISQRCFEQQSSPIFSAIARRRTHARSTAWKHNGDEFILRFWSLWKARCLLVAACKQQYDEWWKPDIAVYG